MSKTILLVEDDLPIQDIYKTAFKETDFKLEVIGLGLEAIKRIKEGKKPDIVLLDLVLPDINGIEILEVIRSQEETKDLPVLILTNYTSSQLQEKGYDLNSEKFLLKTDYTPREIVNLVKKRLKV